MYLWMQKNGLPTAFKVDGFHFLMGSFSKQTDHFYPLVTLPEANIFAPENE